MYTVYKCTVLGTCATFSATAKMWRGCAKVKWRGAAVALMRWREKFAQKSARWCGVAKISKVAHVAVARTKKSGARPALLMHKYNTFRTCSIIVQYMHYAVHNYLPNYEANYNTSYLFIIQTV